jgi:tetratricopeptide (TPR) repeat protein
MQRYRVNYRLLATLVIAMVVAAPAAYGLWWFQVDRNATRLLAEAELAEQQGDLSEAFEGLSQFVKLRQDDIEARLKLGRVAVKLSQQPDLEMQERSEAYFSIIDAVQEYNAEDVDEEFSDDPEKAKEIHEGMARLRRDLIELHMAYNLLDRGLKALDELDESAMDGELYALKVQCLFALKRDAAAAQLAYEVIGYDRAKKTFDVTKAKGADQAHVYALLTQYLNNSGDKELALQILDQMVAANPESLDAFMLHYRLNVMLERMDEARASLERAYEIAPEDAGVLQAKGAEAINDYQDLITQASAPEVDPSELEGLSDAQRDQVLKKKAEELNGQAEERLDEAAKFFAQGHEKYPDDVRFYDSVARIAIFREKYDEAMAVIEEGLKKFDIGRVVNAEGMPLAIELQSQKIDILLARNDIAAVEREIKALRELPNLRVQALADYYAARMQLYHQNWLQAAQLLNDVKHRLVGTPNLQALASASQGACHMTLGQYDLALEAYTWALERNPKLPLARVGQSEAQRLVGQQSEDGTALQFDAIVKQMLALPPAEQDWKKIEEEIEKFVRTQAEMRGQNAAWILSRIELLKAQMFVTRAQAATDPAEQRKLFTAAREAVTTAYRTQRDDPTVQLAAPRVLMLEPDSGPAKALELLDAIIEMNKKRGVAETLPFRLLRIDCLFALQDAQLPSQLRAATEGMEEWSPANQAEVWANVAAKFEQLGQLPDAELSLKEAIKLSPTSLLYRVALFELARKQADDAAMRAAQQGVLEIVKNTSEPDYVLTEVKRMMVNFATGAITKDEFSKARTMLNDAIRRRPNWADLYVLSGQLWMVLEQDANQALAAFDLALKNGPTNVNALNLQVRLLKELGRFAEAREKMNSIPDNVWVAFLDRVAADVLRNVGETKLAFREAKKLADSRPNDAATQLWFAQVAFQAEEFAAAEAAHRAAVAINPYDPELWSPLLDFYMRRGEGDKVESTIREAQLSLDEEYLTLLTAQQNRLFGRFPQAESIFLSSYRDQLDNISVCHRLAEFYLVWGEQAPEHSRAAAPYLNRILRAANEGKIDPANPIVAWARRQAAHLLSLSGSYQDSLKAERLLSRAVANNQSTLEGEQMLVDVLDRRHDPASSERIIAALRQMQSKYGLQPNYERMLGKALYDIGEWTACEKQMRDAIGRHPNDLPLRVALIEMLIERKDEAAAQQWITRLESLPKGRNAIPLLRTQLAAAMGDKELVRKLLESMTPNLRVLSPQQLEIVKSVALHAREVGDTEYGLQLMAEYARRAPGHEMDLAFFTALYGDIDAGLSMLQQLFPTQMESVLTTALEMLRKRRDENPEKLDAALGQLIERGRRDDPDSASRIVLQAESFEIQQRFDEAVAAYKALLARDDAPQHVRSMALNNFAFLLAMQKQDLDLALNLANEAMEIRGPISDILDTRALVYINRGEFNEAVKDLRLAVKMDVTASKYFHLAEALLGIGDEEGAIEAWKQAEARGISVEETVFIEQDDLRETMQKIEALRSKKNL